MTPFACRRHRAILVDFVDRRERGPRTPAALEHLARCERCERELAEIALTVIALRRAGRELALVPVPTAQAARIVATAVPPKDRWAWRLQLGGLFAASALSVLLVVPGLAHPSFSATSDGLSRQRTHVTERWRAAEARVAAYPDFPSYAATEPLPQSDPDGRPRPWKEVPRSDVLPRAVRPS
jgi:anti-sigma factor RsiW